MNNIKEATISAAQALGIDATDMSTMATLAGMLSYVDDVKRLAEKLYRDRLQITDGPFNEKDAEEFAEGCINSAGAFFSAIADFEGVNLDKFMSSLSAVSPSDLEDLANLKPVGEA